MAYEVQPINVTGTPKERIIDPRSKKSGPVATPFKWWLAQNEKDLATQLLSTTEYLKRTNQLRIRQASVFTRLFNGKPLYNFLASTATLDNSNQLPIGRPTANICYSCTDTLTSRISQDRPKPTFLTEAGDYRRRKLAKQANQFILGEFFRTKIYDTGALIFRDGCILGDGLFKVFSRNKKVQVERTLETELLTDYNDAYYGKPQQLIQLKLVDRGVFMELFPDHEEMIASAAHGNVDTTPRSTETVSDQFIIAEGWHLRSGDDAEDGRHSIVCSGGTIHDEVFEKDRFPFVKFGYNPGPVGWFSQGLTEILMPTQMELYRQLIIGSQNFELMGVPRVLVEEMSKILETSFNNRIGSIIKYRNTPPEFVNAAANNPEWFQFVTWLIQNGYQMSGISAMSAAGTKPAGLDSGESIREFDQIQNDRFAAVARRYQNIYPEAAELIIDTAADIIKHEGGTYKTQYYDKQGVEEIDFKAIGLLKDCYVIQLYEESSLPKDPAGRQAALSEKLAAGEITYQEFRRLSSFPDLEQSDQLAAALEERILNNLDAIVEDGQEGYKEPDNFLLDPSDMATTLTVNYINKYAVTNIEPEKMDLLRQYFTQIQDLKNQVAQAQAQQAQAQQQQQLQMQEQLEAAKHPQKQPAQVQVAPPAQAIGPTSNVHV